MGHKVGDIARALGAESAGDVDFVISGAAEPAEAGPLDLAMALNPSYAAKLAKGQAQAAMVWAGADWQSYGLKAVIFAPRGRLAMAGLTQLLDAGRMMPPGVHPMTAVDPGAVIGSGVSIGPFVSVGAGAQIGQNARIAGHVSIGADCIIGADALILEGVHLGPRVRIGDRFIAQPGVIIGGDGFSFVTQEVSGVEEVRATLGHRGEIRHQAWQRIHSLGAVEIGDDVEIGANSCVDRGTIRATRIGRGTKLDNLVQIGHNVVIGEDCLICGQVGVAGSARIGNRVVLGGQTGVVDNIFVGDDVITGGGTLVQTNAPAGRVLLGHPAVKMDQQIQIQKAMRRLPRLMARLAAGHDEGA